MKRFILAYRKHIDQTYEYVYNVLDAPWPEAKGFYYNSNQTTEQGFTIYTNGNTNLFVRQVNINPPGYACILSSLINDSSISTVTNSINSQNLEDYNPYWIADNVIISKYDSNESTEPSPEPTVVNAIKVQTFNNSM